MNRMICALFLLFYAGYAAAQSNNDGLGDRLADLLGRGLPAASGIWSVEDRANDEGPGRMIEVREDGRRVAAFVHGEGQNKPYLAVYDTEGRRLSNPGLSADGKTRGRFPHHRGLFIGWNKIGSDLGSDDLWHMTRGASMKLASIESAQPTAAGAMLEVTIHWASRQREGDPLEGLLLKEKRRLHIARSNGRLWVDQCSDLQAARAIRLQGDLQHAGVHFRADAAVDDVRQETRYLWSPAELPHGNGRIVSDALQWVNFRFPLHGQWHAATQLNHPANRATELSWRDYGRFGFFFADALQAGETRVVATRLIVDELAGERDDQLVRQRAQQDYDQWTK